MVGRKVDMADLPAIIGLCVAFGWINSPLRFVNDQDLQFGFSVDFDGFLSGNGASMCCLGGKHG